MALKPYSDEDALKILLKVEVHLHGDRDVVSACHTAPTPTPLCKKIGKAYPAPRSGKLAWFLVGGLPQPFPVDIDPEPRPVMSLTAETLGLRCKVLSLVGWNAARVHHNGHSLLKGFDVRDKRGSAFTVWLIALRPEASLPDQ